MISVYAFYIVTSIITAGISLALSGIAFRHQDRERTRAFAWLMLGVSGWCLLSGLSLLIQSEEGAYFAARTAYIFITAVPVLWMRFSYQFGKHKPPEHYRPLLLLWIGPFISLCLAWTNHWHHWFWRELEFFWVDGFLSWKAVFGTGFWFHTIYSYSLILLGAVILFYRSITVFVIYRLQTIALLSSCLFSVLASIPAVLNLTALTLTPFGLAVTGLILTWAVRRSGLLDLRPIARELLIEQMQDGMIILNERNIVVDINPAALKLLVDDERKILGSSVDEIFSTLTGQEFCLREGDCYKTEITVVHQGQEFHHMLILSPLIGPNQKKIGSLIHLHDITEQVQLYQQVEHLANTDPLTGLPNRRHFFRQTQEIVAGQEAQPAPCSFILIDIDHFKSVNDQYGHQAGDEVLGMVADRLTQQVRAGDIVARYGGEEFAVFLPDTTQAEAEQVAQRLRQAISSQPFALGDSLIPLSISIGMVSSEIGSHLQIDALIKMADNALYAAKKAGRNTVRIHPIF